MAGKANRLDPRLHPYKADIAANFLEDQVETGTFVKGALHRVHVPITDMVSDPAADSRTSQALFGESFMVYQTQGYWAWGQLLTDDYVGWVDARALVADDGVPATHLVATPLTRATNATIKVLGDGPFSMGAQLRVSDPAIRVGGSSAVFTQSDAGALPAEHLRTLSTQTADWVDVAQMFVHTPYVWGGRSGLGIDCSALMQLALQQAGIACPRDSDMQEASLGTPVDRANNLLRGDLVFWPGHVGVMLDGQTLLHANAFAMATVPEALESVEARAGKARAIKRL